MKPDDTIDVLKKQLEEKLASKPNADMQTLHLVLNPRAGIYPERKEDKDTMKECAAEFRKAGGDPETAAGLTFLLEVEEGGCIGEAGSCCEWTFCLSCVCLGLGFIGVLAAASLFVAFQREEMVELEHLGFVGAFFGVLGSCSIVFCIFFLLPRYTGKRGVRASQSQVDALARETWIWTFQIRGLVAKVKVLVLGVALSAWTKFAQLFALTLIPESLDSNHTIIPELYVQIGDVVLLDLEKLVEEDAETNTTALDAAFDLIPTEGCTSTLVADTSVVTANDEINCALTAAVADDPDTEAVETVVGACVDTDTAQATCEYVAPVVGAAAQAAQAAIGNVLAFGAGEDAYHNKFLIFLAVAAFVSVVVCITKFFGCLEGKGSEGAQKLVVILVGTVSGVVTIPLYHHLLSALDCTWKDDGLGPFANESGFEWDTVRGTVQDVTVRDAATAPFTGLSADIPTGREECYGEFGAMGVELGGEWTPFAYMIMAMIGICAFHWPITLYLMVRPDSPRDIDEDVRLIVDETIAQQGLKGRIVNGAQSDVSKLERYPDGTKKAGRIKTSCCLCCASFKLSEVENVQTLHMKPGIARGEKKAGYQGLEGGYVDGYVEGSEAHDEYKKLFKADSSWKRMSDTQKQKLKAKGQVPEDMPSMNRIQLRRYAFQNNVPQVDIDDIDAKGIMKDLDTPEGGVSGPRKRPREKAFEFGMEVAIVVVATLFSGESELRYGEIGNHCADSERAPDAVGIDLWNERACQRARTEDECNTQPPSFNCAWEPRPLNMVELRLGLLFIMHLLQALYFVCVAPLLDALCPCCS